MQPDVKRGLMIFMIKTILHQRQALEMNDLEVEGGGPLVPILDQTRIWSCITEFHG